MGETKNERDKDRMRERQRRNERENDGMRENNLVSPIKKNHIKA